MTNEFKKVHFRVETGYVWEQGLSSERKVSLKEKIRKIFLPLGFEIIEPTTNGACEEAINGTENLYLHPQDFSGLVKTENIEIIKRAIENNNIEIRTVDVYETVYEAGEEWLLDQLQGLKSKLKKEYFEAFKTTRKNKFLGLNGCGLYSPIKLVNENLANKVYRNFIISIIDELYKEGLLIKMSNDSENRYFRSLNATELKKWQAQSKKKQVA